MDTNKVDYKTLIEQLEWQHQRLRFEKFSFEEARRIGDFIANKAKKEDLPITIDIRCNKQQLFHLALEGTTKENDQWILRKNRVANHFKRSSYYISILLKSEKKTIEEKYQLDSVDYAPYGGSYPIILLDGSQVGTITVSGLPDHEDHAVVVEAIEWYLA